MQLVCKNSRIYYHELLLKQLLKKFQGLTHRWPNKPDYQLVRDLKRDKNQTRSAAVSQQYSTRECRAMVTRGKPVLDCANEAQSSLEREFCKSSHARFQNEVPLASLEPFKQTYRALSSCYPLQFAFQTSADLYKTEVMAERIIETCSSLAGLHNSKPGTGW